MYEDMEGAGHRHEVNSSQWRFSREKCNGKWHARESKRMECSVCSLFPFLKHLVDKGRNNDYCYDLLV